MHVTALIMLLQAASGDPTHVDQLPSTRSVDPASRLPRTPDKPASATITQLPKNLEPLPGAKQTPPVTSPTPTAASRATLEIARAADMIRGRGQQVTPELLAREVGPDVLNIYLAQTNGTALPAGAPDPTIPTTLLPGTIIVPPGGKK